MILLLDNYDSFVYNVARSLRELGGRVEVVRSDALTLEDALAAGFSHLVISPGPGTPADAGVSLALVRALRGRIPVLGICLGHQVIAEAYGGRVVSSSEPVHGRATPIVHTGEGIFAGLPSPFLAGRYHSLAVDSSTLPPPLRAVAWSPGGEIMALRAEDAPVWGVQFHPESILTPAGETLLASFLQTSRAEVDARDDAAATRLPLLTLTGARI
jgi:anthranilate synthase/aminodeoxychorismate synthase-like glutamine amidotransferase